MEDIKQNKLDKERQILYDCNIWEVTKRSQMRRSRQNSGCQEPGKEGMGKLSFSGFRVSVLEDENF